MNPVQRIAKNASFLFSSQLLSNVFDLFFVIYAARYFGDIGYGTLSFALAFTAIFGIVADMGLELLVVREISRNAERAKTYLGNVIILKIFLAGLALALIAFTINALKYPTEVIYVVYLIALSVVLSSFAQTFFAAFQAYERMEYQSIGIISNSILKFSSIVIAAAYGLGIIAFASLYVVIAALIVGYSVVICTWKFFLPTPSIDLRLLKSMIKSMVPLSIFNVFILLNLRFDSIILSYIKGYAAVGWYNAGYSLVLALNLIPASFVAALFPLFARTGAGPSVSLRPAFERSFRFLLIVALPIVFATSILARDIIGIIYGDAYSNSVIAFRILIVSVVPVFLYRLLGVVLLALHKERSAIWVWIATAASNVAINIALIPFLGFVGASIATVVSETVAFCLFFLVVSKSLYDRSIQQCILTLGKEVYKPIIIGLTIFVFLLFWGYLSPLAFAIIGVCTYLGLLFATQSISKGDLAIIRMIFKARGTSYKSKAADD